MQVNSLGDKKRGVNADDIQKFIISLTQKIPRDSVLILDNAKIHHAESLTPVWSMLKTTFGIDVIYLPPYSPFLNPIEFAFNDLKMAVKSEQFRNRSELSGAIQRNLPKLTTEKATQFFQHVTKYYNQCAVGIPFTGKPLDPVIPDSNQNINQQHKYLLPD